MNNAFAIRFWAAFAGIAVVTWIVYLTAWASPFYRPVLFTLSVAALLVGIVTVWKSKRRYWALLAVVLGFVAGQWWLAESVATQMIWGTQGFAP
jgi:hypothetical protein